MRLVAERGRRHLLGPFAGGLALFCLTAASPHQGVPHHRGLLDSAPVQGLLQRGAEHRLPIELAAGDFVDLRVSFSGFAQARLEAPDGSVLQEATSDHRGRVSHRLVTVAGVAGRFALRLAAGEHTDAGTFRVTLHAHRPADDMDRARAAAAGALLNAMREMRRGSQADFDRARAFAQTAHEEWVAAGDPDGELRALLGIGHVSSALRDYARGGRHFERAVALAEHAGDDDLLAEALQGLAEAQHSTVGPIAALPTYTRALTIWKSLGNALGTGATLDLMGSAHHSLGDSGAAVEHLEHALPYREAAGDRIGYALTLHNRGMVAFYIGDLKTAVARIQRAVEVNGTGGDLRATPHYMTSLARVFTALGEPQRAFETFTAAIVLWQQTGDHWGEALAVGFMGEALTGIGEDERAFEQLARARAIYQKLGDARLEGRMLIRLGLARERMGQPAEALRLHEQALARLADGLDRPHETEALIAIGRTRAALGHGAAARRAFAAADALVRSRADRRGEAALRYEEGRAAHRAGDRLLARRRLEEALTLRQATHDRAGEAATLYEIARLDRADGRLEQALETVRRAMNAAEDVRNRVVSPALRLASAAIEQPHRDLEVDLLLRLHAREPHSGHDRRAFEAHARGRAVALADALTEARLDIEAGADPALLAEVRAVRVRINALEARRNAMATASGEQATLAAAIQAGLDQHERLQAELRRASPAYASLVRPAPLQVADVQRWLDPDTRLLAYHVGDERGALFVVGHSSFDTVPLPARQALEPDVRRVVELLRTSRRRTAASQLRLELASLGRRLLPTALPRAKRLVVAADGPLHYLPFAVLPVPAVGNAPMHSQDPLASRYTVAHVPSLSAVEMLRHASRDAERSSRIAVFADPVFTRADERVRTSAAGPGAAAPAAAPIDLERSAREAGVRLERLRFSRREAEAIQRLALGDVRTALDFEANRDEVQRDELAGRRIVHFATHALVNDRYPALSGLVLSLVDPAGQPQDGFLRLHDIFNLRLRARLVVLSGCQTAIGRSVRGEGLVSLARGFLNAGAAQVIVSLWAVSDEATAALMEAFYEGLLRDGLPAAAALRAAQLKLRHDPRWSAPYYWAGFVLQGDWR